MYANYNVLVAYSCFLLVLRPLTIATDTRLFLYMNSFNKALILFFTAFAIHSCAEKKQGPVVTPWGEVQSDSISDDNGFTMSDIQTNGELIMLTMSGPETYYDYRGRNMGAEYLLCERFARKMGVSVRVELCKDTAEMVHRLGNGDADLIAFPLPKNVNGNQSLLYCGAGIDSLHVQWAVAKNNRELADSLNAWFTPSLYADVRKEEHFLLSTNSVKRHVYAPFLNRSGGVISRYDHLFKRYAPIARWDWRLMAAQCYQESCFDPQARSWAGARGLMQIMPSTASHLGLPMASIHDPEANIRAASKYIAELTEIFREVQTADERRLFVLAAYNGGHFHIKDAMALARKNGRNAHRWRDVAQYVLALQRPAFYNDPVVKYGYMRGSETVDYVDRIRQRYAQYRGVPYGGASVSPSETTPDIATPSTPFSPHKAKRKHRFHI